MTPREDDKGTLTRRSGCGITFNPAQQMFTFPHIADSVNLALHTAGFTSFTQLYSNLVELAWKADCVRRHKCCNNGSQFCKIS